MHIHEIHVFLLGVILGIANVRCRTIPITSWFSVKSAKIGNLLEFSKPVLVSYSSVALVPRDNVFLMVICWEE